MFNNQFIKTESKKFTWNVTYKLGNFFTVCIDIINVIIRVGTILNL